MAPPIAGTLETTLPEADVAKARVGLLEQIALHGERQSFADELSAQIGRPVTHLAPGHEAPIAVVSARLALDRCCAHKFPHAGASDVAAGPLLPRSGGAGLIALWGIDPCKTDAMACEVKRVAINNTLDFASQLPGLSGQAGFRGTKIDR